MAGVDGCRAGSWFKLYDSGDTASELVDLTAVLRHRPEGLEALAIDIPIALLDGPRACDRAARQLLGWPRRNSVFSPPCRAALAGADHGDACRINESFTGKRLTRQAWAIAPKIKEVDDLITPAHQSWVCEIHPEVCFWFFSGRTAMQYKKKSKLGRNDRIEVLKRHLPNIEKCLLSRPRGVAADDLLDPAVAALTARRWLRGEVARVCEPELNHRGLRMDIVY